MTLAEIRSRTKQEESRAMEAVAELRCRAKAPGASNEDRARADHGEALLRSARFAAAYVPRGDYDARALARSAALKLRGGR